MILPETNLELRNRILTELQRLQTVEASKDVYRALHVPAVNRELDKHKAWVQRNYVRYSQYFADGADINPQKIQPILLEVTENWQGNLFRLARLTWSLPYTIGYGRRLRFLIMDAMTDKLIGILGFQSPPLDFPARDRLFSYAEGRKVELVNQTMDIYTLGAVPPFGRLLGGKLVALAASSNEVREAYRRKYENATTQMEKRVIPADLIAATTTSAFGRSSIYNRLSYKGRLLAQPIGYTEGYGSFHLATVYPQIRKFLDDLGVSTHGGFGVGPRIVWQTYTRAFQRVGLSKKLLKHGLKREVFLFPYISNLKKYMEGKDSQPAFQGETFSTLAEYWRTRWLLDRADRVDGWHAWSKDEIRNIIAMRELPTSAIAEPREEGTDATR